MTDAMIPDGFHQVDMDSPFDDHFGGMYAKSTADATIIGFRVARQHTNLAGVLHGGAMATLADWQVAAVKEMLGLTAHTPTINLSIDYLAPAPLGSWLECHAQLQKRTGRMLFTRAEIFADGTLVARSSGIYHLPKNAS